jgi:hypothetical protein
VIGDADGFINIFSLSNFNLMHRELISENVGIKYVKIYKDEKTIACTNI